MCLLLSLANGMSGHIFHQGDWTQTSLHLCYSLWIKEDKTPLFLPLFICWGIWILRNRCIFEDLKINTVHSGLMILSCYKEYWSPQMKAVTRQIKCFHCDFTYVGFFDGAAVDGFGGCGFILYMTGDHLQRG